MIPTRADYLLPNDLSPMKYIVPLLFFALLSGCAAVQHVDLSSPAEVADANAQLTGERTFVNRADGSTLNARIDLLRADSVVVYELDRGRSVVVATRELRSIEAATFRRPIYDRAGFTLGAVGGLVLMILVDAFTSDSLQPESIALGAGAAVVGGTVGTAVYSPPSDDRKMGRFVFDAER